MRKKDLAKKWRKVFSAILAATMITTSVVPESLVLAADVEETQGFGDGESLGFESGQDEVSDGNSEENQNVPETQDEDSDDTENGEDGFTDGVEAFSSENGTTVEAGFQSQAIVEEIQERINVLPTVDEFKAMADGTTVEDSTLNQKQTDVYNEAQAIADELEQLSEEEQGQVDTSKLEALFEYFNSMMERADVEISDGDAITSSGTYYLSGNYSSNTGIKATGKVNIYLKDNVKFTRTDNEAFLKSGSSSNDIAIDGNGFTMESNSANEYTNFVQLKSGGKVSVSNIIMHVKGDSLPIANQYGGTFIWNSGTLKTDGAGMLINNSNGGSTLEINGGYLYNGSKGSYSCISGGNVNITGGEIEAPNTTAISGATTATINGGTIKNSKYGIVMSSASKSLTVSNNAKFENNTADIWLSKGKMFTVDSSFKNTASVALSTSNYPTDNSHVQITTDGTDARMLTHFTCANKDYSIGYENGHLYIYKHTHAWNDYLVTDNVITAKCSVSSNPCTYHTNGLKLILSADSDIYYSGSAYEAVVEKNEITSVTGENPSSIKYYLHQTNTQTTLENSGAATTGGAPVYAGKYTAKVSIGGVTANADFTIEKANSSATVD